MGKPIKARKKKDAQDSGKSLDGRYFSISSGDFITLITPGLEYCLGHGRVIRATVVKDYESRVREEVAKITGRALATSDGFLSGDYRIQFNHNEPIK